MQVGLRLCYVDLVEGVADPAHRPRQIVVTIDHWLRRHAVILPLAYT